MLRLASTRSCYSVPDCDVLPKIYSVVLVGDARGHHYRRLRLYALHQHVLCFVAKSGCVFCLQHRLDESGRRSLLVDGAQEALHTLPITHHGVVTAHARDLQIVHFIGCHSYQIAVKVRFNHARISS